MATGLAEGIISITVNGNARTVSIGTTLTELLAALDLDPRMIVVEHNGSILYDRGRFATVILESGDTLELVHFVGGG